MHGLESSLLILPEEFRAFKMLRITVVDSSNSSVRLRVEGRLTGPSVEELRQACEPHVRAPGVRLFLDLEDVSFADFRGIEMLEGLKRSDVTLLNLVPYIALRLRDPQSRKLPSPTRWDAAEGRR